VNNATDISTQGASGSNWAVTLTDGTQLTLVNYNHALTNSNFN